jgi:hypothetical protein
MLSLELALEKIPDLLRSLTGVVDDSQAQPVPLKTHMTGVELNG